MFGSSCLSDIRMKKARNKAGELLINGFHCHGKGFGFHFTDENSQQTRHLLRATGEEALCQQSKGNYL